MAAWYELFSVLMTSFLLNLIPFAGPSNFLIASNAALLSNADPFSIGFLVALGSASAKFIHYAITFFIGDFLGQGQRKRLDNERLAVKHWAFLVLFIAAATPIPDEPVIIPLGLLKYNPAKFYAAFFFGKLSITIAGAFLGRAGEGVLAPFMSQQLLIIVSIILTMVITIVLLKVDFEKIARRVLKRKTTGVKHDNPD